MTDPVGIVLGETERFVVVGPQTTLIVIEASADLPVIVTVLILIWIEVLVLVLIFILRQSVNDLQASVVPVGGYVILSALFDEVTE